MTAWFRFWDYLKWMYPWFIVVVAIAGLLFISNWSTWKIAHAWFRHKIKDCLPETARSEIVHRDQLLQMAHDLFAVLAIQVAGRLISEDDFGIVGQRQGNGGPLLLSGTEFFG